MCPQKVGGILVRFLLAVILVVMSIGAFVLPAAAAECQFQFGFKVLAEMIPSTVGNCLDNEYHNPNNGDGLQRTEGGLLVWRKADNWTAFTNGHETWINGPMGLQKRLNIERFEWEPDYVVITDNPTPSDMFAYITWLGDRFDSVQAPSDVIDIHFNMFADDPNIASSPAWRTSVITAFESLKQAGQEMQTYRDGPLPRPFAPLHNLVVSLGQDIVLFADEYITLINTVYDGDVSVLGSQAERVVERSNAIGTKYEQIYDELLRLYQ